jgi:multidrug transporter EmrE-like cation transporter
MTGSSFMLWLAILFNILTNVGFKYAALAEKTPVKYWTIFAISLVFGFLNSICFTESLKSVPLNIASAVFFSVTVIGLCLMSYFWFQEALNWKQTAGIFVIIAGVVMVNAG